MTLKELVRASICGEMEDITACETDAEAFPKAVEVAAYLNALAVEKRDRLPDLGRIFKEGTGFRQRAKHVSRSIEAALRARALRAEKATAVYAALVRVMNKPEYKEAMNVLAERELAIVAELKKLLADLKKPA